MTRELKVLVGAPASGKSTWAATDAYRKECDGWSTAVISRDAIRFQMLDEDENGTDYFKYENAVFAEFVHEINECLALCIDYIYADATHISPESRTKLLRRLGIDEETDIVFEVFEEPLEILLYRNAQREGRAKVPVKAIKSMVAGFSVPDLEGKEISDYCEKYGMDNSFKVVKHNG